MLNMNKDTEEYLAKVREFADEIGLRENLEEKLSYLDNFRDRESTRCDLFPDFAPHSFVFTLYAKDKNGDFQYLFNGGLIYHGPHDRGGDGGAPTYSVSLNPMHGWSIHT